MCWDPISSFDKVWGCYAHHLLLFVTFLIMVCLWRKMQQYIAMYRNCYPTFFCLFVKLISINRVEGKFLCHGMLCHGLHLCWSIPLNALQPLLQGDYSFPVQAVKMFTFRSFNQLTFQVMWVSNVYLMVSLFPLQDLISLLFLLCVFLKPYSNTKG